MAEFLSCCTVVSLVMLVVVGVLWIRNEKQYNKVEDRLAKLENERRN